ncbi:putative glycoside hydrolase superfamily [Helianthus anomalus]
MMREAFAHPAVEGIMLWGFWESFMSRDKCHLVDAEGQVNEAGKRFIELKKEWLSEGDGYINEQSEFSFRGFEGTYQVIIQNKIVKTFVVQQQQQQQVVYVD